jgi:anti-sigma regulatory factor (Ser/Thr protein kinase)
MSTAAQWEVRLDVAAFAAIEPEIGEFLSRQGVAGRAAYVSNLVIEEIVRNLIAHTPPYADEETITVALTVTTRMVTVVIEDERPPFNPFEGPELDVEAPLEQRRPGGMGLHLVRNLADDLTYENSSQRNRLTARVSRQ